MTLQPQNITVADAISLPTIFVLMRRWPDLRRAISSGGAARPVLAVHAHPGDQAAAAGSRSSRERFSARLPSTAVTPRALRTKPGPSTEEV